MFMMISGMSADRNVSPGYGFTTVPECGNCISAPPHLPAAPCRNTVSVLLRKLFDLLNVSYFPVTAGHGRLSGGIRG
jgi:hypothetical protein